MESLSQQLQNAVPGGVSPQMPSPQSSTMAPHTPVLSRDGGHRAAVVLVVGHIL